MKKLNVILAALVASVSIASAEELSISATFGWESEYVFRGVGLAEDTFMPAVDVSYGAFYAGLWAALPVDTVYGNEVDLYAGYGFSLSETVSLDVGATYYTYPDAQADFFDSDVNTLEFYVGASFETVLSPSVYVYYDIDLEALTAETSIGHTIAVDENSGIDLSAHLGYVDADSGAEWWYYGAGVAYSYAFTDSASVSVGVNYYAADTDAMLDGGDDEFSYGFSFSAGF